MRCQHLDPLMEAIAEGSLEPGAEDRDHLETCPICQARLARARVVHEWLSTREAPVPPASFTAGVMARVGRERWRTERVFDIGFNVAIAAGVLLIVAGGAGLAWSLGFLTITIDWATLARVAGGSLEERVVPRIQTLGMAAMLLTMTLALWWWAETDTSM
jgi:anti-sigma factor RsiW